MIQTNLLEIKYKKIQYWYIEETSNIIFSTEYCVVKDYIYFSRWERNGRRRQIISQWMFVCLFCWINVTNASHTDIIIHEHIFIWCRHNLFDHNRSSARDWARITRIQGPCFSSNRFPECVRALTESSDSETLRRLQSRDWAQDIHIAKQVRYFWDTQTTLQWPFIIMWRMSWIILLVSLRSESDHRHDAGHLIHKVTEIILLFF